MAFKWSTATRCTDGPNIAAIAVEWTLPLNATDAVLSAVACRGVIYESTGNTFKVPREACLTASANGLDTTNDNFNSLWMNGCTNSRTTSAHRSGWTASNDWIALGKRNRTVLCASVVLQWGVLLIMRCSSSYWSGWIWNDTVQGGETVWVIYIRDDVRFRWIYS